MRKIFLVLVVVLSIFLSWCSNEKTGNIGEEISIIKPMENLIWKQWEYTLNCKTEYYINTNIGWTIIKESYIKTSKWNERDTLYVDGEKAKFFGAEYLVIQDDDNFLIIMRHYEVSWLTEVVTINKESWIWFDIKTLAIWISWAPVSATYILSCLEI
jgi:hypothetical protein